MSTLGSEKLLRTLSSTDRLACKTLVNNISSHFPRMYDTRRKYGVFLATAYRLEPDSRSRERGPRLDIQCVDRDLQIGHSHRNSGAMNIYSLIDYTESIAF